MAISGPAVGRMYRLHDHLIVGRSTEADIVLVDEGVSRLHARIWSGGATMFI
ncbi:MAG: FHA domain-containing protein [Myxococcota bacterium]